MVAAAKAVLIAVESVTFKRAPPAFDMGLAGRTAGGRDGGREGERNRIFICLNRNLLTG